LLALALGVGVYISFTILETLGWPTIRYKIPLAIWSTIFQLVPIIGPYIGALPAVLGGFLRSPLVGTEVIALYIFLNYAVNQLVGSRIGNRFAQIHPAILIIFIVAVSQLGFIWVLLTAPLISILVGLYRYLYGRLSDPPSPAGILPDQPLPEVLAPQQPPVKRTPLAYRRIKQAQPPPGRI
jgi:predicted PurR-regulated permease PerM